MKSLHRRLALLSRRVRDLKAIVRRLDRSDRREAPDWIGEEDRALTLQEACYELTLTTGQLMELEPVSAAFWPETDGDSIEGKWGEHFHLDADVIERALGDLAVRRMDSAVVGETGAELFESMVAWREWRAVRSFGESMGYLTERSWWLEGQAERLRSAHKALSNEARESLSNAVKDYLANQWMYPWARVEQGESLGERYGVLFEVAGIPYGDPILFESDVLNRIKVSTPLDAELAALLKRVLDSLERAVAEYGLSSLEDILADDGDPMPDLPSEVGVIPGDRSGPCPKVLLAIATSKSTRSKHGAAPVMRKLREALIACCDASGATSKTEIAIFVGPLDAIEGVIEESSGDLERHLGKGTLKAFIPVGLLRNKLNVLNWR